jgi:hypothetical protein
LEIRGRGYNMGIGDAMPIQNLEDLLKDKKVTVKLPILLFSIVLNESEKLRQENPGFTVSQVMANNPVWIGLEVEVLAKPGNDKTLKTLRIGTDSSLKTDEIRIVYYDPEEVKAF